METPGAHQVESRPALLMGRASKVRHGAHIKPFDATPVRGGSTISTALKRTSTVMHPKGLGYIEGIPGHVSDPENPKYFGQKRQSTTWTWQSIPKDLRDTIIDEPVWQDVKKTNTDRHSRDEALDLFQRVLVCLKGDENEKVFAACEVSKLGETNAARTFKEIVPPLIQEAGKIRNAEFHFELSSSMIHLVKIALKHNMKPDIINILHSAKRFSKLSDRDHANFWLEALAKIMSMLSIADAIHYGWAIVTEELAEKRTAAYLVAGVALRQLAISVKAGLEVNKNDATLLEMPSKIMNVTESLTSIPSEQVQISAALILPELAIIGQRRAMDLIFEEGKKNLSEDLRTAYAIALCRCIAHYQNKDDADLQKLLQLLRAYLKQCLTRMEGSKHEPNTPLLWHFCRWSFPIMKQMKKINQVDDLAWICDAYFSFCQFDVQSPNKKLIQIPLERITKNATGPVVERVSRMILETRSTPYVPKPRASVKGSPSRAPWSPATSLWKVNETDVEFWLIRQECAKHFLDVYKLLKNALPFKSIVYPILQSMLTDSSPSVRKATTLHLSSILLSTPGIDTGMLLKDSLITALSDDSIDVIETLVPQLAAIIKELAQRKIVSPKHEDEGDPTVGILSAILFCEERLSQSLGWRPHTILLQQSSILPSCFNSNIVCNNLVPVLLNRMIRQPQLPVKVAAAQALTSSLRYTTREVQRDVIRQHILKMAASPRTRDRTLFLFMSKFIMERFSANYIKQHFLDSILSLLGDKVPTVRASAGMLLARFRRHLLDTKNADADLFNKVTQALKKAIASETDKAALESMQKAFDGQGHSPLSSKENHSDRVREEEESRIAAMEAKLQGSPSPDPILDALETKRTSQLSETRPRNPSFDEPSSHRKSSLKQTEVVQQVQKKWQGKGPLNHVAKATIRMHAKTRSNGSESSWGKSSEK